jgi:hypothetical protein
MELHEFYPEPLDKLVINGQTAEADYSEWAFEKGTFLRLSCDEECWVRFVPEYMFAHRFGDERPKSFLRSLFSSTQSATTGYRPDDPAEDTTLDSNSPYQCSLSSALTLARDFSDDADPGHAVYNAVELEFALDLQTSVLTLPINVLMGRKSWFQEPLPVSSDMGFLIYHAESDDTKEMEFRIRENGQGAAATPNYYDWVTSATTKGTWTANDADPNIWQEIIGSDVLHYHLARWRTNSNANRTYDVQIRPNGNHTSATAHIDSIGVFIDMAPKSSGFSLHLPAAGEYHFRTPYRGRIGGNALGGATPSVYIAQLVRF